MALIDFGIYFMSYLRMRALMRKKMAIGIKPLEEFKEYTIAIAKGEIKPRAGDPKIWFDSIESVLQILSTKNQTLLRIIEEQKPNSLAKLAEVSGRQRSNLNRTLKRLEKYGIVSLKKENKFVRPQVRVNIFNIKIDNRVKAAS